MTHTFVELEISEASYEEIKKKLIEANYEHCFIDDAIDMHGIALIKEKNKRKEIECL